MITHGVELIAAERLRQQYQLGWTKQHDAEAHPNGELRRQALAILMVHCGHSSQTDIDSNDYFGLAQKFKVKDHTQIIRALTIAGALVAAELDRLVPALMAKEKRRREEGQ